jgi:hypothetical protein
MGRKKRTEGQLPPTSTVKLDRVLAGRAKIVANELGMDLAKYLSDLIRPSVNREFAKIVEKMKDEGRALGNEPKG